MIIYQHDVKSLEQIERDVKRLIEDGMSSLAAVELAQQLSTLIAAAKMDLTEPPVPKYKDAPLTGEQLAYVAVNVLTTTSEIGDVPAPLRRTMAAMADILVHCIENRTGLAGARAYYASDTDAFTAIAELCILAEVAGGCSCLMCAIKHYIDEVVVPEDTKDRDNIRAYALSEAVNAVGVLFSDDDPDDKPKGKPKGKPKVKPKGKTTLH